MMMMMMMMMKNKIMMVDGGGDDDDDDDVDGCPSVNKISPKNIDGFSTEQMLMT